MCFKYLLNCFERASDLLLSVSSHKRVADESIVRSYGRRHYRVDKYAFFEQVVSDFESLVVVANIERDDWSRCVTDFATHRLEAVKGKLGDFPEVFLAFRLREHDVKSCVDCSCRARSDAGCEDI